MNIAIIQARLTSSRFPNKVIKKIAGKYLLQIIINRLKRSKKINKIIVAIPNNQKNLKIKKIISSIFNDIEIVTGSENNLVSRFVKASNNLPIDSNILRITADCPLIDPLIIDNMLTLFNESQYDYLSNTLKPSFPDGLDVEIFKKRTLIDISKKKLSKFDQEHVTPYIKRNKNYKKFNFISKKDYSNLRLTVDDDKDLNFIRKIIRKFDDNIYFEYKDIINLYEKLPNFFKINSRSKRNEGSKLNTGQKIWTRAKKIIPGGNMLFSKRPEMFLPKGWPVYFKKTSGCKIWDLDNRSYYDFCSMGIGTNILGYSHPIIDKSIMEVVKNGNMSTFNSHEEVLLAEKLISIHPWAQMVKFARTGADANSMAIRIARAFTEKSKIAVCGYHGWHDWYLSGFLNSKYSKKSNMKTNGVFESKTKNTIFFDYNNLKQLENILSKGNIAAVMMEVERNIIPNKFFLSNVRKLTKKYNVLLIFDECTSAFREMFGGHHLKYSIKPDIAVYGKALGNGYAITAVLGKKEVMNSAQDTFISSTFNTERIGSVAGLKTLELMEENQSWQKISIVGDKIKNLWLEISKKHDLNIEITGLRSNLRFIIKSSNWIKYKTFITQEMLKKGFLATNTIFTSLSHTDELILKYIKCLDLIFKKINEFENGLDINKHLEYPVCHTDFKRLN